MFPNNLHLILLVIFLINIYTAQKNLLKFGKFLEKSSFNFLKKTGNRIKQSAEYNINVTNTMPFILKILDFIFLSLFFCLPYFLFYNLPIVGNLPIFIYILILLGNLLLTKKKQSYYNNFKK